MAKWLRETAWSSNTFRRQLHGIWPEVIGVSTDQVCATRCCAFTSTRLLNHSNGGDKNDRRPRCRVQSRASPDQPRQHYQQGPCHERQRRHCLSPIQNHHNGAREERTTRRTNRNGHCVWIALDRRADDQIRPHAHGDVDVAHYGRRLSRTSALEITKPPSKQTRFGGFFIAEHGKGRL